MIETDILFVNTPNISSLLKEELFEWLKDILTKFFVYQYIHSNENTLHEVRDSYEPPKMNSKYVQLLYVEALPQEIHNGLCSNFNPGLGTGFIDSLIPTFYLPLKCK